MKKVLRIVVLSALLFVLVIPKAALAVSYEVEAVQMDVTINADGSLSVVEQRTYAFYGAANGIYWDIPRGDYHGGVVDAQVQRVSVVSSGGEELFEMGSDGDPGTYELTEQEDCLHLKLYRPSYDESVTFLVAYDLTGLVTRWSDAAELYWKYVPEDSTSGSEWHNITATIRLPLSDGAAVIPGENVHAWGHGPLDSEVDFGTDCVVFRSPGVGTAEYLEARVVFPEEWVEEASITNEAQLESILAEEARWAKEANATRYKARLVSYGTPASMALLGLGSVALMKWHQDKGRKKLPSAQFNDKYFRDVPTNDHPAVLGMLYRGGTLKGEDFSATLMQLADRGKVSVDAVWTEKEGRLGNKKRSREWRLLLHKNAANRARNMLTAEGKAIDAAAFRFLNDVVASKHKHTIDPTLLGPGGEPYVLMSFFDEAAEGWPDAFSKGYNGWADAVRSAYNEREFEKEKEESLLPALLGLGNIALSIILCIVGMLVGVPNFIICIAFIVHFGCALYIIWMDADEPIVTFSQEAADIKAQLEALRRWLIDFTRLEEAIPSDVVLWNRLLVMATVLGVADKVVEQLKVHAPELAADLEVMTWYSDEYLEPPVIALGRSVDAGRSTSSSKLYHGLSTYETASTRDSSSSGSGGGFSSGGGGGFSGGGRGGAF